MPDPLGGFRERCKQRGLAFTHQRQVIFEAITAAKDHPTPEAIYETVRRRIPSISLATVYKNVRIFLDAAILSEVSLHHGSLRLEGNPEAHHHLICSRCRSITDLDSSDMKPAQFTGKVPKGFRVERQIVEMIGICASCAKRQSSK